MDSVPAYPLNSDVFVCVTPPWGNTHVGQFAVVSLLTHPASDEIHLTGAVAGYEFQFEFYPVSPRCVLLPLVVKPPSH